MSAPFNPLGNDKIDCCSGMVGHVVGPRAQGNPRETVDSQFDPDTMLSMSWELLFPMAAEG